MEGEGGGGLFFTPEEMVPRGDGTTAVEIFQANGEAMSNHGSGRTRGEVAVPRVVSAGRAT